MIAEEAGPAYCDMTGKRTDWFSRARFGLFVHWGLYALPARGEWTLASDEWNPGEYEKLAERFNPESFNPDLWAQTAAACGMGYVVFTTKHHDGFCMFDSPLTDYKVTNTPFGKDVTAMVAESFRKAGLKVGFYHSLPDWTHPGYADRESPEYMRGGVLHEPSPEQYRDFLDFLYGNVRHLLTAYGKIDLMFFDYTSKYKADMDYFGRERLLDMVYSLQPEIIVNDRLSFYKENTLDFDYYTPEICIPNATFTVKGRESVWETCATMNDHWGYCASDSGYKDVHTVTAALAGCVSRNGNLLLNVGPDASGQFPEQAISLMNDIGEWMKSGRESVVGCGACPYTPPFGCCYTASGRNIFCHFLTPPVGDLIIPGLKGKISAVELLRTGEKFELIDDWGFELLDEHEQRIRTRGVKRGDVMRITLKV